jgi:hypothetical protein
MADGRLKIGSSFLKIGSNYLRIGPAPAPPTTGKMILRSEPSYFVTESDPTFSVDNPSGLQNMWLIGVMIANSNVSDPAGTITISAPAWTDIELVGSVSIAADVGDELGVFYIYQAYLPASQPDPLSITVSYDEDWSLGWVAAFELMDSFGTGKLGVDTEAVSPGDPLALELDPAPQPENYTYVIVYNDNSIGGDSDFELAENSSASDAMPGYWGLAKSEFTTTTSGGEFYMGTLVEFGPE